MKYADPSETVIRRKKQGLGRAVLYAVACLLAIEAGLFGTGFYLRFSEPASYCGQVVAILRNARAFEEDAGKSRRVLVLGDSRMGEGFSAKICDELGQSDPRWFNASVPGSTPRVWSYLLDTLLGQGGRFDVVVLPLQSLSGRTSEFFMADRKLDGQFMPPILPYSEVGNFARSFDSPDLQKEMLLRGYLHSYALQSDLLRLIEHPRRRMRDVARVRGTYTTHYAYTGREEDLSGKVWVTDGEVQYSAEIPESEHHQYYAMPEAFSDEVIRKELLYQRKWIGRIEGSCRGAGAKLVVLLAPRGPLGEIYDSEDEINAFSRLELSQESVVLPAPAFSSLERPEYFFDHLHMNSRGRKNFSATLWKLVSAVLEDGLPERGAR